jgi:hypothetical protein
VAGPRCSSTAPPPATASAPAELIAAGRAEAEQLGMTRELVRFERLTERLSSS